MKRLKKSADKIICGVCGGIADYFNIEPTIVRILSALLTILLFGLPGVIAYLILALIMPENNN